MKKSLLKHLNIALGAMIVGLTGYALTGCTVEYGVPPIYQGDLEDPGLKLMYGVTPTTWEGVEDCEQ